MSGFSADWLALREPFDLKARNAEVETAFENALPAGEVTVLDLASGAGSTVAALDQRLRAGGRSSLSWILTDNDAGLLGHAKDRYANVGTTRVSVRQADLALELERLPFSDVDAVTTSAFLDLVDHRFVERLAGCVIAHRQPFLASLSYDGRTQITPGHAYDTIVVEAVNRHQKTDKGFGAALGPDAADFAIGLFQSAGLTVIRGHSDWLIPPGAAAIQMELISGWRAAAGEMDLAADLLSAWFEDRMRLVGEARLSIRVGHIDFAVMPS
ncbi:hypothetical protein GCM10011316_17820 [Roseibium aquae]|uniref:Methyltransferase family protein n=1 Tax=Roseibium aquae TaxID=1323746 RepID=A0A916X027_9HYPH|nr:class I SAM-dependent methyltransferase [Roseibium aquae]GGB46166.1 hypothetical protein GCM10011316_17820 [Roseibium aquae]